MKEIQLTKGYVATVDDEDYERVAAYKWCVLVKRRADGSTSIYVKRNVRNLGGKQTTQFLHRFILDSPVGMHVDHINGNPLDNCRVNLRVCTHAENIHNQRPQTGRSSKFKGLCWCKKRVKWLARIKVDGRNKYLGFFTSEIDAARAYDAAALKYFGEFARINTYE